MIKDFVGRIKATKQLANERSISNWYNCLFQGIIIIFGASVVSALYTVSFFNYLWEVPIQESLPFLWIANSIIYSIILTYFLLEKLIIAQIYILEKIQKYLFIAWQRFDMWYYRRYRKTSPITEFMAKTQLKVTKLSKTKRRIIMVSLVAFLIILNFGIRVPMIMEGMETETEIDTESELIETPIQEPERQIIVRGAG